MPSNTARKGITVSARWFCSSHAVQLYSVMDQCVINDSLLTDVQKVEFSLWKIFCAVLTSTLFHILCTPIPSCVDLEESKWLGEFTVREWIIFPFRRCQCHLFHDRKVFAHRKVCQGCLPGMILLHYYHVQYNLPQTVLGNWIFMTWSRSRVQ